VGSGALLVGRIAFGPAPEPAFGSPGRPAPQGCGGLAGVPPGAPKKRPKGAAYPDRPQAAGVVAPLPRRQPLCSAAGARASLRAWREGRQHQPRPHRSACPGWRSPGGRSIPESLLEEAEGMLQVQAPEISLPKKVEVRLAPFGACHHSHSSASARAASRPSGQPLDFHQDKSVPTAMGKGPRLPRPSCARTFGCISGPRPSLAPPPRSPSPRIRAPCGGFSGQVLGSEDFSSSARGGAAFRGWRASRRGSSRRRNSGARPQADEGIWQAEPSSPCWSFTRDRSRRRRRTTRGRRPPPETG